MAGKPGGQGPSARDTIIAYTWAFWKLKIHLFIFLSFSSSFLPVIYPFISSSIQIYFLFLPSFFPFTSYQDLCQTVNSKIQRDTHWLTLFIKGITEMNLTMQKN